MKNLVTLIFLIITTTAFSQSLVSTIPSNKNVLIEEFTGVNCGSCPYGHQVVQTLIDNFPNRVFGTHMHSFATGHTEPLNPGEEDLRRTHPDAIANNIVDLEGIPSGIINRREYDGKQAFVFWPFPGFIEPIDSLVNVVLSEPSPLNIGAEALYDTVNRVLTVNSELYSTDSVNGDYRLNVYFIQSNIFVTQDFGAWVPNYNQKHVFREVLTPTWGDTLFNNISAGNLRSYQHVFSNSATDNIYKMQDVEVLVFVTNHAGTSNPMGEVVQAIGVPVQMIAPVITSIEEQKQSSFSIYPNPNQTQKIWFNRRSLGQNEELRIFDLHGKLVFQKNIGTLSSGALDHNLNSGIYYVSLKNQPGITQKLVIP